MKTKIFTFCFILSIFLFVNFISAKPIDCIDQPFGLWHFEDNSSYINDSCGNLNGNLIHLYGSDNVSDWVSGKFGTALNFNGYDMYVDFGLQLRERFDNFSINLWIRNISTVSGIDGCYFERGNSYNPSRIRLSSWATNFNNTAFDFGGDNVFIDSCPITDNEWHMITATFEGNVESKIYCDGVLLVNQSTIVPYIPEETWGEPFYFSGSSAFPCFLNGTIDEMAIFNKTLSSSDIYDFYVSCGNETEKLSNSTLYISQYPYLDLNESYLLSVSLINNPSNLFLSILENGTWQSFKFNKTTNIYQLNVLFNQTGDYPFVINGTNSCVDIGEITGTFKVRQPFYMIIKGFQNKSTSFFSDGKYKNDFAYVTAEIVDGSNRKYDNNLEMFITPLMYSKNLKYAQPVFYSSYGNGEATLKLYESNKTYALRILDGIIHFPLMYSIPNITKSYGLNSYIGQVRLNGTNSSFNVYFEDKDLHQYRWLFNWIFIICLGFIIIISAFLFFLIPHLPITAFVFGIGGTIMLIIFRISIYIWKGY